MTVEEGRIRMFRDVITGLDAVLYTVLVPGTSIPGILSNKTTIPV